MKVLFLLTNLLFISLHAQEEIDLIKKAIKHEIGLSYNLKTAFVKEKVNEKQIAILNEIGVKSLVINIDPNTFSEIHKRSKTEKDFLLINGLKTVHSFFHVIPAESIYGSVKIFFNDHKVILKIAYVGIEDPSIYDRQYDFKNKLETYKNELALIKSISKDGAIYIDSSGDVILSLTKINQEIAEKAISHYKDRLIKISLYDCQFSSEFYEKFETLKKLEELFMFQCKTNKKIISAASNSNIKKYSYVRSKLQPDFFSGIQNKDSKYVNIHLDENISKEMCTVISISYPNLVHLSIDNDKIANELKTQIKGIRSYKVKVNMVEDTESMMKIHTNNIYPIRYKWFKENGNPRTYDFIPGYKTYIDKLNL